MSAVSQGSDSMFSRMNSQIRQRIDAVLLGQELKAKVLRGGVWLGGGSVGEQALRFGRNMVLARLLAPAAFGTMAIALSTASIIDSLLDVGVREALIQNPQGHQHRYLNVAWWLSLGRGLAIYSVIFVMAPWISQFYGNRELSPLLRVTLLSILFHSAMSTGANLAVKQMKFSKWAAINHGGAICGIVLTVILSLFMRDVWALAIGYVAENAGRCAFSYLLCPYFPSFGWDREAARDLLRFSRGVFGLSFLNLVFGRADIFVLARLYPATSLGLYTLAVYLIQTPTSFLMNLLGQTLLPTFSQIQGENHRLNQILFKVTSLILALGLPAAALSFFCGRSLLTIAYGQKYAAAAVPLAIASCVAVINLVNGQITTVFLAKGQPHLHRRCVAVMAVTMIALIYPSVKWFGFVGAQMACLTSVLCGYLLQVKRIQDITKLDLVQYGKSYLISIIASLFVVAVCLGSRSVPWLANPLPNIALGILGCLLAYVLTYAAYEAIFRVGTDEVRAA